MSETFDIGPLSWVNDQINQSLDIVLANLTTLQNNISDTSALRFSQTHLYQATGAFDMVGLNGCKRFCSELEKLTGKLEKKTINATPELIELIVKAVNTLKTYLQDLLNGAPDISLKLYSDLQPIVIAQGETLNKSELFFPDTSYSAPKDLPIQALSDSEFLIVLSEQRKIYQISLLDWLKTKQLAATQSMTQAINNVCLIQTKKTSKTLWWAAGAFIESLEQSDIAEQADAKKLCRKLDQELRELSNGIIKPHDNLLRDILYFVSISTLKSDYVAKVKSVFELDALVDKNTSLAVGRSDLDKAELNAVEQLISNLERLTEQWAAVSTSLEHLNIDVNNFASPVAVDNVLITQFVNTLSFSMEFTNSINQPDLVALYGAFQQASIVLRDDASKVNYAALVQFAATLNLLDTSLQQYQQLNSDQIPKIQLETRRLKAVSEGVVFDELNNENSSSLDRDTLNAVIKQIKDSLKIVEQALDAYFRNPSNKSPLLLAEQPIIQLEAVLTLLNLDTPSFIAKASGKCVKLFQEEKYTQNQDDFMLVAECLSMVGLYIDEMPRVRPESEQALQQALSRLQEMLELAGATFDDLNNQDPAIVDIAVNKPAPIEINAVALNAINSLVDDSQQIDSQQEDSQQVDNQQEDSQLEISLPEVDQLNNRLVDETASLNLAELNSNADVSNEIVILNSDDIFVVDRAVDEELLDIYLIEAEEVLANIAQNCQALRINQTDQEALIELRRSYHTLKGSGRTVGLTALGNIAGQIEVFLNQIIDQKSQLSINQLHQLEQINSHFANWTAKLRNDEEVEINQTLANAQILGLKEVNKKVTVTSARKKTESQVLIGGTRKMSRALYNIFINETMNNITLIEQDAAKLIAKTILLPSSTAKIAIHTLASNALATQFTPMGVLGRALEAWLDEISVWNSDCSAMYLSAAKSLSVMWQRASELKNPRPAKTLIESLVTQTQQIKQQKIIISADKDLQVALPSFVTQTTSVSTDDNNVVVDERVEINETIINALEQNSDAYTPESPLSVEPESSVFDIVVRPSELESFAAEMPVSIVKSANLEINEHLTKSHEQDQTSDLNDSITLVDSEILTLFLEEAREIMPLIGADLRAWRASPSQIEHADAMQRSLHTLKGSARMATQAKLGDAVHELEDQVMRSLKRNAGVINFDQMFIAFDSIGAIFDFAQHQSAKSAELNAPANTDQTNSQDANSQQLNAQMQSRGIDRNSQYLRMRADALDRLINDAGEISITRSRIDREVSGVKRSSNDLTESVTRLRTYLRELEIEAETQMQSRLSILQETNETFDPLEFDRFTRLQELTRMIAESVNDVATIQHNMLTILGQSEAALQQQDRMNRDLQQTLLNVRMLPFKQISERLHRVVRQTGRELKKAVNLVIIGESTEIDRSVLEKIGPSLEHLLRNAVAHGLETTEVRKVKNKPEFGTITLKVHQQNDEISIGVFDDGAGIDLPRIKAKAIEKKLYEIDDEISDQKLMSLIFEPGFSTSEKISQIAGRGVGLDVVQNEIASLGGRVDVINDFGEGTNFKINLPITLTVAQVLLVRAGESVFGIPVSMIEQAQKIKLEALTLAYETGVIVWNNERYPLHYLQKLLDDNGEVGSLSYNSLLLLRVGSERIALHVDEVLSNQELVMKPIGSQLARVPGIVGAAVAADGNIMFIISPMQLVNRKSSVVVNANNKVSNSTLVDSKFNILVVDDSLTMRKVLGRLLEREGFEVTLAKDGLDAMQVLLQLTPDAILTDIEMPRMDGFGLARNIRDDARTVNTPLIMISSRTADKHQNLAKEIGVDAFFGKPVQDDELVSKVLELIKAKKLH